MKHDLQRRRLAAAIRPDQARKATGLNRERHTFEGGAPAVARVQAAYGYSAVTMR